MYSKLRDAAYAYSWSSCSNDNPNHTSSLLQQQYFYHIKFHFHYQERAEPFLGEGQTPIVSRLPNSAIPSPTSFTAHCKMTLQKNIGSLMKKIFHTPLEIKLFQFHPFEDVVELLITYRSLKC